MPRRKRRKPKKDIAKYKAMNDVFRNSQENHDRRKAERLFWKDVDLDKDAPDVHTQLE